MSRIFGAALAAIAGVIINGPANAATVTVAVASNFSDTASALGREFEGHTSHRVVLVRGSSGKLFAQIVNGAPFDLFLSADTERPLKLLEQENRNTDAAFTYAIGELAIWSPDPSAKGQSCLELLKTTNGKIAIANPRLAPYGKAAQEFLQQASLWRRLEPQLVFGENIAQALQFAASGNAVMALVARSQLQNTVLPAATCISIIPADSHAPIEQVGVITSYGSGNPAADAFAAFMQSHTARAIIRAHGYRVPARQPERDEATE